MLGATQGYLGSQIKANQKQRPRKRVQRVRRRKRVNSQVSFIYFVIIFYNSQHIYLGDAIEWAVGSKPPTITAEVSSLLGRLAHIDSDIGKRQLNMLVRALLESPTQTFSTCYSSTFHGALLSCDNIEIAAAVNDVAHMITLIKVAFWIERFFFFFSYSCC